MYDCQIIGTRIRARRVELGLSRDELAEKMNRASKYVADIERGTCGMSIETLLLFCKVLGMSPNALLLDETARTEESTVEQQIQEGLSVCTEEQKLSILQTIRLFTQRV